ncbi:Hypothetical protein Tpal_2428 [Trichococcus palustris]|jgi:putative redox protein|uniref:Uncharacterized protein n=1 Tax=Trichococcus palustris TaxID=140314 RepID=A0A143YVG1_9LACT|nr:OsmC family protein [Trichococcus palustris]CZQ99840.1 Hypothetical protein Tpal_2428 [Trichococcus palustris]SFK86662.1 putative redox protein [Trichococcus palustris]
MIVTTTWTGGRKFTAKGDSGYDIKMDATPAYGGMGEGATPTEMLLASLAGCIGIDVTMVLNHFLDKITKIEFITDGTRKEEAPKGYTAIHTTLVVDGDIDAKKVWRAIDLSEEKYCSVSDSLSAKITYDVVLNGEKLTRG